jgi:hypothetical protein
MVPGSEVWGFAFSCDPTRRVQRSRRLKQEAVWSKKEIVKSEYRISNNEYRMSKEGILSFIKD